MGIGKKLKTFKKRIAGGKDTEKAAGENEGDAAPAVGSAAEKEAAEANLRISMDAVGTMNADIATKYGKTSPVTPVAPEAANGEENEGSRRLSIDGDMIAKVKKEQLKIDPNKKSPKMDCTATSTGENCFADEDAKSDDADDGTEKRIDVKTCAYTIPTVFGGNSRAGWSKIPGAGGNASEKGTRKTNQDSYGVWAPFSGKADAAFFCVFDGHGAEGRPSSQVVRDNVPRHILRQLRDTEPILDDGEEEPSPISKPELMRRFKALTTSFEEAEEILKDEDSEIDHVFSGTTAVASMIVNQFIFTAWAGDSRAIIGRGQGSGVYPVDLTHDQKPSRTDEKKRVRALGGRVTRWKKNIGPLRVWLPDDWIPGLAMTRSVGDTVLTEFGVIPTPEVTLCEFGPKDQFIVLASDGVWEFMSSGEVATFVAKLKVAGMSPSKVANKLVAESVSRWKKNEQVVDDTTAVVIYLNYTEKAANGLERPQQLLENGDLIPFSPRNDEDKPA